MSTPDPLDAVRAAAVAVASHVPRKLISPEERLFWPYLLGSLAIALGLWLWRGGPRTVGFWSWLVPRGGLRSASARLDLTLALAWGGLKTLLHALLVATPFSISSLGAVLWCLSQLDAQLGPATPWHVSTTTLMWSYALVLFVAWDAARYGLHRLLHGVDALWQLHQVHHSATVLTPLTLHRSHPGEAVLYTLSQWAVTVLVTTVAVRLLGAGAVPMEVLGVNAFGFVFSLLGGNLRHCHAAIAYPNWLERIVISPAQHQLHHSKDRALQGCNYGVWLACWDRLAGSLRHGSADQVVDFGVATADLNHDPHHLGSALLRPLVALRPQRRRHLTDL